MKRRKKIEMKFISSLLAVILSLSFALSGPRAAYADFSENIEIDRGLDGLTIDPQAGDFMCELEKAAERKSGVRLARGYANCPNCNNIPKPNEPDCNDATADPCILHNGNHYLNFMDMMLPGMVSPFVVSRTYNTFIRTDVPGWTPEAGSWCVEDGELNGQGDRIVSNNIYTDFYLELEMETIQPGEPTACSPDADYYVGWINFRYTDLSNMYYLCIHKGGILEIAKIKNGVFTTLCYRMSEYNATDKNRIEIEMNGGNLRVYINGNEELSYYDSDPLESGHFGLNAYWSHVHYDNIDINQGAEKYDFNYTDNAEKTVFGYGWSSSFDRTLDLRKNGDVYYHAANGVTFRYTKQENGSYKSLKRVFSVLTKTHSGYEIEEKSGQKYSFSNEGNLLSETDRYGNTITYSYLNNRLQKVIDSTGREILFTYSSKGKITSIKAPLGYEVEYKYDSFGHLIEVVLPGNRVQCYEYEPLTHNIVAYTDENGHKYTYTYYYNDRLRTQTDPEGNKTEFLYYWDRTDVINDKGDRWEHYFDEDRMMTLKVMPDNTSVSYKYDSEKNLISETDSEGNVTEYDYDEYGNRTLLRKFLKYKDEKEIIVESKIDYDTDIHKPVKVIDEEGNITEFIYYPGSDLLYQQVRYDGVDKFFTEYKYNDNGQLIEVKDSNGAVTKMYYEDEWGNQTRRVDALGNATTSIYNALGKIVSSVDPMGRKTEYTYYDGSDSENTWFLKEFSISMHDTFLDKDVKISTQYEYDKKGNKTKETNAQGHSNYYFYDAFNNVTKIVTSNYGKENEESMIYEFDNTDYLFLDRKLKISMTDANGNTTLYRHDTNGRLIEEENANGEITQYQYDKVGNLTKLTNALGNVTDFSYDSLYRLREVKNPLGNIVAYTYDKIGNMTLKTDANGNYIQYEYDALYHLQRITYPDTTEVRFEYDDVGNRIEMHDSTGKTSYEYDQMHRLLKVQYPTNGVSISYEYDRNGNKKAMTSNEGTTYYLGYTLFNQPQQIIDIDNDVTNFIYDQLGRVKTKVLPNDIKADYDYDCDCGSQRPLSIIYTNTKTSENVASYVYTYDLAGNVQSLTTDEGVLRVLDYDKTNQIKKIQYPDGEVVTYEYDAVGNRTLMHSSLKGETVYKYDSANRLLTAGNEKFTYDNNGNMVKRDNGRIVLEYTYDYENRLMSVPTQLMNYTTELSPGWNLFSLPAHPLDAAIGNVLSDLKFGEDYDQITRYNTETAKFEHYVNNPKFDQFATLEYGRGYEIYVTADSSVDLTLNNLYSYKDVQTLEKDWNLIGTPTKGILSVKDALNNLEFGVDYNQLSRFNAETGQYETFADSLNDDFSAMKGGEGYWIHMLKSAVWQMQTNNTILVKYEYNGDGQRVRKYNPIKDENVYYYYDGPNCVIEKNSNGETLKSYTNAAGIDSKISQKSTSEKHYFLLDHLNTTRHLTDETGQIDESYEYDVFGEIKNSKESYKTDFLYTGRRYDSETGLYYYRARMYDALTGRFTTEDPIGGDDDANLYRYVKNNPCVLVDPYGTSACYYNCEQSYNQCVSVQRMSYEATKKGIIFSSNLARAGIERSYGFAMAQCNRVQPYDAREACYVSARNAYNFAQGLADQLRDRALNGAYAAYMQSIMVCVGAYVACKAMEANDQCCS